MANSRQQKKRSKRQSKKKCLLQKGGTEVNEGDELVVECFNDIDNNIFIKTNVEQSIASIPSMQQTIQRIVENSPNMLKNNVNVVNIIESTIDGLSTTAYTYIYVHSDKKLLQPNEADYAEMIDNLKLQRSRVFTPMCDQMFPKGLNFVLFNNNGEYNLDCILIENSIKDIKTIDATDIYLWVMVKAEGRQPQFTDMTFFVCLKKKYMSTKEVRISEKSDERVIAKAIVDKFNEIVNSTD